MGVIEGDLQVGIDVDVILQYCTINFVRRISGCRIHSSMDFYMQSNEYIWYNKHTHSTNGEGTNTIVKCHILATVITYWLLIYWLLIIL